MDKDDKCRMFDEEISSKGDKNNLFRNRIMSVCIHDRDAVSGHVDIH